jgi:hypothetical protein
MTATLGSGEDCCTAISAAENFLTTTTLTVYLNTVGLQKKQ